MTSIPVRLVCLDLGGVLIRICRGWEEACQVAQLQLPPHQIPTGQAVLRLAPISRAHESGLIDDAEFDRQIGEAVGLPAEQVAAAAGAWLKGPYPGAVELVRRLGRADGVRSACLSNTNPRHWQAMTRPGPQYLALEHLTWRFTSFEIGQMKPDAGIYEHVERTAAAEGIEAASIVFFDDNAENVAAALRRGWQAVRIDPADDPPGQVADELARRGVRILTRGASAPV